MIKVLGSSSKGNCYLLETSQETLILEAGISYKDILKGLKFNLSKVCGCLVTHEHKDHALSANALAKNGVDIYTSKGTKEEIGIDSYKIHEIEPQRVFKVGSFIIIPFLTQHDCKEPMGFLIQHDELDKILFATDTYFLKYKFNNVKHILIECNFSEDIIKDLEEYQSRLLKSHMSLEVLKDTLSTWDLTGTKDITLIHISENNGEPDRFVKEIEELTNIKTYAAVRGLEIRD